MYSRTAERWAIGAHPATKAQGYAYPDGWCLFDQVYGEIADQTPIEGVWYIRDLIGKLPSIKGMSPKTQGDIVRVVVRDMQGLPLEADRVQKRGHGYCWVFGVK